MPTDRSVQNYKNHARVVPAFHYFALPVLAANVVWTVVRLVRHPSVDAGMSTLVAVALVVVALYARGFALTVQDRVIRLEMRLRLRDLCPPDLVGRIPEFSRAQLVALRFAGDAELPTLARKVLDDRMEDRKAIKLMIRNWEADHFRA